MLFSLTTCSYATILVLPETGDIVGEIQSSYPEVGETLAEVGRRFNIGYYEMVRANPKVPRHASLLPNIRLLIPGQFIVPNVARTGIVINLSEYRLYYFPADENVVITFPVGIGRVGWNTPLGITQIIGKQAHPTWRPTKKIRIHAAKNGYPLPNVFPSGPNNPLGEYVLRLGWPTFLIHGTNRVDGVGARVSAGCIRMLPNDIDQLFSLVGVGTSVRVINQPVKIGVQDGAVYIQIHPLLTEQKNKHLDQFLKEQLKIRKIQRLYLNKTVHRELTYPTGLVYKINS